MCLKATHMYIRGVKKTSKVRYELADKLIPFLWGIIRSTEMFKFLGGWEVLKKYSKEILKNTKEKSRNRIFSFFALKTIF